MHLLLTRSVTASVNIIVTTKSITTIQVLVDRMFVEGEETSSSVAAAVSLPADIGKPLFLQV